MKIYVFALLVVAAVAFAYPYNDQDELGPLYELQKSLELAPAEEHHRERRFTCDFLSGFGVSHSACATHCYAKLKGGGSCNSKGVCVCRK